MISEYKRLSKKFRQDAILGRLSIGQLFPTQTIGATITWNVLFQKADASSQGDGDVVMATGGAEDEEDIGTAGSLSYNKWQYCYILISDFIGSLYFC